MMGKHSDCAINACHYIKRGLFMGCRYPAFTKQYIREKIELATTAPSELRDYRENSAEAGRTRAVFLVLIYLSYSFKNLFLVYQQFRVYNYDDFEGNVRPISLSDETLRQMHYPLARDTLKSVSCLTTNCSHLRPLLGNAQAGGSGGGGGGGGLALELGGAASAADNLLLAEDVAKLPLFAICNPRLDLIYTPVDKLDYFGILAFLASMYTVFLLGAWTTIQQAISPAASETLMFVTAPQVTARVMRDRAWQIMRDLAISYHNYRIYSLWQHTSQFLGELALVARPPAVPRTISSSSSGSGDRNTLAAFQLPPAGVQLLQRRRRRRQAGALQPACPEAPLANLSECRSRYDRTSGELKQHGEPLSWPATANPDDTTTAAADERLVDSIVRSSCFLGKTEEQIERAVGHCLPIVRTDWWRPRIARVFVRTLAISSIVIIFFGLFCFTYIQLHITRKRELLIEFEHEMRRLNCFVWRAETRLLEPAAALPIGSLDLTWSAYAIWETAVFNYMAGLTIGSLFTYYWALINELGVWLAELRMFIVASLLVTRFSHAKELEQQRALRESFSSFDCHCDDDRADDDEDEDDDDEGEEAEAKCRLEKEAEDGAASAALDSQMRRHFINTRHFYNIPNLRRQFEESTVLMQTFFSNRIERRDKWTFNAPSGERENAATTTTTPTTPTTPRRQFDRGLLNSSRNDRCYSDRFMAEVLFPLPGHVQRDAQGQLARQLDQTGYDIETMEHIYVNFRLLVEHVHGQRPSMVVAVSLTYMLNYGYVLVALFCRRKFANFVDEPNFVIIWGFIIATYLVYLGANFHANAKKLQPLLWSIIAQLTHSRSVRVRHLRSLWLKQVLILDNEGGLALEALGMRITYVYIIQLVIWTATLFVIALKPHGQEG